MDFDKLSKGEQYKLLRIRDAEHTITIHQDYIDTWESMLARHQYTPFDEDKVRELIQESYDEIAYFRKQLVELGAENEEFLTDSIHGSESPIGQFTGITCTTVL